MTKIVGAATETRPALTRVAVKVVETLDQEARAGHTSRSSVIRRVLTEWAEAKWRQAASDEVSR